MIIYFAIERQHLETEASSNCLNKGQVLMGYSLIVCPPNHSIRWFHHGVIELTLAGYIHDPYRSKYHHLCFLPGTSVLDARCYSGIRSQSCILVFRDPPYNSRILA